MDFQLTAADGLPWEMIAGRHTNLLLVCEHAANRIPACLGDLGLPETERARHIAWDIGAAGVTRNLAAALDCPAVLARFSRLVIDLNRPEDHAGQIPEQSDGTVIPANQKLSAAAKENRRAQIFRPFHAQIAQWLGAEQAAGRTPTLINIHSFTPCLRQNGTPRPWQIGVLYNRDRRLADPLLAALRARGDLVVGDNEPYSAQAHISYTMQYHADQAGLPYVAIELRQDEIATSGGQERYASILATALAAIL